MFKYVMSIMSSTDKVDFPNNEGIQVFLSNINSSKSLWWLKHETDC